MSPSLAHHDSRVVQVISFRHLISFIHQCRDRRSRVPVRPRARTSRIALKAWISFRTPEARFSPELPEHGLASNLHFALSAQEVETCHLLCRCLILGRFHCSSPVKSKHSRIITQRGDMLRACYHFRPLSSGRPLSSSRASRGIYFFFPTEFTLFPYYELFFHIFVIKA